MDEGNSIRDIDFRNRPNWFAYLGTLINVNIIEDTHVVCNYDPIFTN